MRGRSRDRTSLYVHLDLVHLNTITHRQKVEDQNNKKVCSLLHVSIRHVDSNPMLHAHREKWRRIRRRHQPRNVARSKRSKTLFPVSAFIRRRRVLVFITFWSSSRRSRCCVLVIVVSLPLSCVDGTTLDTVSD